MQARREAVRRARRRRRRALGAGLVAAAAGLALGLAAVWADADPPAAGGTALHAVAPGDPSRLAFFDGDEFRPVEPPPPPPPPKPTPRAPGEPGALAVVGGGSTPSGPGELRRYVVEVEGGLPVRPERFARTVERVLANPRGWAAGGLAFQRVDDPERASFRIAFASPGTVDRLCLPLVTNGIFSCVSGSRAVLNSERWTNGADAYGGDLARYRVYMVNHEVGHLLGHGHRDCPAAGAPAPVMMQQTKGVAPCRPNPWPLPFERGSR